MIDQAKLFFLITGSDLLFNKLDEIEIPIIGFHYLRNSIISDSDFKRYPVLSLKWLYMTSSGCLESTRHQACLVNGVASVISCLGVI